MGSINHPLSVEIWGKHLAKEAMRESYFAKFAPEPKPLTRWEWFKIRWRTRYVRAIRAWNVLLGRDDDYWYNAD